MKIEAIFYTRIIDAKIHTFSHVNKTLSRSIKLNIAFIQLQVDNLLLISNK